ncbi:hypothetical protein KBC04_01200 [Candidatus Babeliales bacterium]|nr:hypothetical protein [Candidatus Babeliales bacterium]MBP9843657.1 hypothetical protein [Candidatus Babeliales bacterium]
MKRLMMALVFCTSMNVHAVDPRYLVLLTTLMTTVELVNRPGKGRTPENPTFMQDFQGTQLILSSGSVEDSKAKKVTLKELEKKQRSDIKKDSSKNNYRKSSSHNLKQR